MRVLNAVARTGILPASTWSAWASIGNRAPQWDATADVLVALRDKGLVEPTENGLFDLFAARLLPDYRITDLGREVLS